MSFICDFCHKPSKPGTIRRTVVVTREKKWGGTEIARERPQCSDCYDATPEAAATRMADGRQYLAAERKSS